MVAGADAEDLRMEVTQNTGSRLRLDTTTTVDNPFRAGNLQLKDAWMARPVVHSAQLDQALSCQRWQVLMPKILAASGAPWEPKRGAEGMVAMMEAWVHPAPHTLHPTPCNFNPQPYSLHSQSYSLHLQPSTLLPTLSTLLPAPSTLNPQPSTLHLTPSILNPQPYTLNPQPSTLHPTSSTLSRNRHTRTQEEVLPHKHREMLLSSSVPPLLLSNTAFLSISFRLSTPPKNRQLNVLDRYIQQYVHDFAGELTF